MKCTRVPYNCEMKMYFEPYPINFTTATWDLGIFIKMKIPNLFFNILQYFFMSDFSSFTCSQLRVDRLSASIVNECVYFQNANTSSFPIVLNRNCTEKCHIDMYYSIILSNTSCIQSYCLCTFRMTVYCVFTFTAMKFKKYGNSFICQRSYFLIRMKATFLII